MINLYLTHIVDLIEKMTKSTHELHYDKHLDFAVQPQEKNKLH